MSKNGLFTCVIVALIATTVAACTKAPKVATYDPTETLVTQGIVASGSREEKLIWFELVGQDQRFIMDVRDIPDAEAVFKLLQDAAKAGGSLSVRFDLAGARMDSNRQMPTYFVRELAYDGRRVSGMRSRRDSQLLASSPESDLAQGIALYSAGKYREASDKVGESLNSKKLEPEFECLAYKTRANALSDEVENTSESPDDDSDRQLIEALSDLKNWQRLCPDDEKAPRDIALVLRSLGAYESALDIYAEMARDGDAFTAAIYSGATYRQMGDLERALKALDDLVAKSGPQTGMKFHYHRGWTLIELKRYDEAIRELTMGIDAQPGYSWAYIKRACALAQLGKIGAAVKDQEQALHMLHDNAEQAPSPYDQQLIARAENVLRELRSTSAKTTPTDAPCVGYRTSSGEWTRKRSHLLPSADGKL